MRLCAAPSISKISETARPPLAAAKEASGITWAGGDIYYAVDDAEGKLYEITLRTDPSTGALSMTNIVIGAGVTVADATDIEGCAFDRAAGTVWVSNEPGATIWEVDTKTGATLRTAQVPDVMKRHRYNLSLESLAISQDGLVMWTCNEGALDCDGPKATKKDGTVVRLTKFTRKSPGAEWAPAGQWAYKTGPVGSDPIIIKGWEISRSGVSDLAVLPDGTLLVLERSLRGSSALNMAFQTRIYSVDLSSKDGGPATDVSGIPALDGADFKPVKKTLLFKANTGWCNYEGMCLGPRLADGSTLLVLISDGTHGLQRRVMTLSVK